MAQLNSCGVHAHARSTQSAEILATLESHPLFRAAHVVLIYHSLKDEVDTHDFIDKWSREKIMLLPVVKGDELEIRRYTAPENMAKGPFGIGEPTGRAFTDYDSIELAVVPGVAFDRQGHRLGHGKGYYDRLLPRLKRAYMIGVCFPYQIISQIPAEEHDIRMDEIISTQGQ